MESRNRSFADIVFYLLVLHAVCVLIYSVLTLNVAYAAMSILQVIFLHRSRSITSVG